ncbi:protein associated with UVRAG as autophagy enhancer isoform X3 [Rousettus aegyptiacus]|uniref:Rubicon like autophagy enhancer n=1 Tax=Rousettus aegyptiacus TaxID=9407 RepID=A0A7J8DYZ1_ROUAE|nr:protein associated with UVRAG as autophagy enhancer isoform X3 [Rousettus aegyptiacus]KAF6428404.1 rubicon like autophagy enhancer [Rousettus aegyptiacus]
MVSQSSSWEDSLVDPWEGGSEYSGSIDGSPRLLDAGHPACQSDLRFTRHKATWINPQCVQQQLQDLPVQIPTVGNSGSYFVRDGASPLGPSPLSLEYSVVETVLSKDTVGSVGSSGEKSSGFSFTSTQEQTVLPGSSPWMSLFARSKILTASPRSEADSACFTPSHLPVSTGEGAVQFSGRSISLNSFSQETFVFPVDIEKENAHFYASDMIISVMENMKCDILSQQHMESWSTEEANGSLGKNQADSKMTFYNIKQESGSSTSSDSGYELGEFSNTTETCRCTCSSSKSIIYEPNFNSAELIAKELYKVFQKCWMLSQVNYQLAGSLNASGSIVVSEESVQKDFESSVDKVEEIEFKPKIRGMEDWAPPRFQVIFNVHPPLKRDLVVAAQNFFCAGCGTPIEPKFVKRLRYCEYLGKYFCDCCHSYAESCLPARILTMWDFRKYHVSNFSKWLLNSLWHQPIFNLLNTSHSLYAKAKELDKVREIQEQLFHIKKLLKTCRFAESALKEFEQVPRHLTDELHLFSLEDMIRVKKGMLVPLLKDVLKATLAHVACCELCQGKGFICEFCRSTVVIFPFQTTTCRRCSACRACFHKQCFRASECPRCARITARRRLLESLPSAAT